MVHKESIGRVVGNDGQTYIPSVENNDDGTLHLHFERTDAAEAPEINANILIPYFKPYKDDTGIHFSLETTIPPQDIPTPTITFDEIRGKKGENGKLNVQPCTESYLRENLETITTNEDDEEVYLLHDDTIYIDIQQGDKMQDHVNAFVIYEDTNGRRQLEKINSVINFADYYTSEEVENIVRRIDNDIETALNRVRNEQQSLYNTLTNGLEITASDYTLGDNVINVMSDTSVESLRQEIVEQLKDYVKGENIDFDSQTGTINIRY